MNKRQVLILLIGIIIIGSWLRLDHVGDGRFLHESIRDITISEEILKGNWRLEGVTGTIEPTSSQQSFGPLYYYLIALGLKAFGFPTGPIYIIAILNIISIILCFVFVKEYFGEKAALVSSALLAVSPWHIIHISTILTTPNYLTPFILLLMYSLFKVIIDNKNKYIILAFVSLAILSQFHLSVLWLFIFTAVSILLYKRDLLKNKYFIIAIGTAFIFYIPFLIYNLTEGSLKDVFSFIGDRYTNQFLRVILEAFAIPVMLGTNYLGKYLLGDSYIYPNILIEYFSLILVIISSLTIVLGGIYILKKYLDTKDKRYSLLIIWILIPIIGYISKAINISPHYMNILFPSQFIIIGVFLSNFLKKYKKIIIPLIFVIIFGNLLFVVNFYNYIDEHGSTNGLYHESYNNKIKVINYIKENNGENIIFYKYNKREYPYLSKLNYTIAESIEDLPKHKGFLILNRFDYRWYMPERDLTEKDIEFLKKYNYKKIGETEVIEFS